MEKVKKGSVVTCTITAIADGGLEVRVGDNLNGFIRKADLSRERSEQDPNGSPLTRKSMLSSHNLIRKHVILHFQSKRVKSLKRSEQWLIMGHQTVVQALEIFLALHWRKKMMAVRLTQTVR